MALGHTFDTIAGKCKQYLCNKPIPDGFFPSKIVEKLMAEAERNKVTTANGVFVPNQYTFAVTKEEYQSVQDIASLLQARILVCLDEAIERQQYHTQGTLSFQFVVREKKDDESVAVRPCEISVPEIAEEAVATCDDEDCNLTRVFDKALPIEDKIAEQKAVICVVEGANKGKRFVFTDNRVNIGRRENNELSLNDGSVSRLHAYIIKEAGKHMLYDARSLNGTYLNEVQIIKQVLHSGDLIKVGNTLIEYEVLSK